MGSSMHGSIGAAVSLLCGFVYDKVPRRKVDLFAEQLANALLRRAAARPHERLLVEVNCGGERTDDALRQAAAAVKQDADELLSYLPAELTLALTASSGGYRTGADNVFSTFYTASAEGGGGMPTGIALGGGGGGRCAPQLRLRPVASDTGTGAAVDFVFELEPPPNCEFTVAQFAMTRFGSAEFKQLDASSLPLDNAGTGAGCMVPMAVTQAARNSQQQHYAPPTWCTGSGVGTAAQAQAQAQPHTQPVYQYQGKPNELSADAERDA